MGSESKAFVQMIMSGIEPSQESVSQNPVATEVIGAEAGKALVLPLNEVVFRTHLHPITTVEEGNNWEITNFVAGHCQITVVIEVRT
jgi:hypothetical protein